jgi:hypothetical protein
MKILIEASFIFPGRNLCTCSVHFSYTFKQPQHLILLITTLPQLNLSHKFTTIFSFILPSIYQHSQLHFAANHRPTQLEKLVFAVTWEYLTYTRWTLTKKVLIWIHHNYCLLILCIPTKTFKVCYHFFVPSTWQ